MAFLVGTDPGLRKTKTPTVDTFAAGVGFTAGSSTQITLSDDPGTEKHLQIFFDGVGQHRSTYTVSSSTVTFDTAIPTGVAEVEATYAVPAATLAVADGSITAAKLAAEAVPTTALNRDNREAFLQIASLSGKDRLNMEDGIVDPYTDMSDIDESTSTGEKHDATFKILPRAISYTDLNATQFSSGDTGSFTWTNNDVVSNSLDDSISTDALDLVGDFVWEFALTSDGSDARGAVIGVSTTVGSGGAELPTSGTQWSINGYYGHQLDGSTVDAESQGWLAGFTWYFQRVSGTIKLYKGAYPNGVLSYTYGTTSTANLAMVIGQRGGNSGYHANEVRLVTEPVGNMVLVSNAFTADAVPATGRIYFHLTENESITINTDVTAEISRDGGTTWTTATLVLVQTLADGTKAYEDSSVTISGQPSGTAMKYRIKTLNTKDVELLGTVFQWST